MMKVAMSVIFLAACLLAQASAQQNWWEMNPDGTVAIANSRATTATPTSQAPAVSTQCPCVATPEYNPVCGDNRQTYTNPRMLECAQKCGQNVRLLFHGRCEKLA